MIDRSEKRFESDIEEYLLTEGGYTKADWKYFNKRYALDLTRMTAFISNTQPKIWKMFSERYGANA